MKKTSSNTKTQKKLPNGMVVSKSSGKIVDAKRSRAARKAAATRKANINVAAERKSLRLHHKLIAGGAIAAVVVAFTLATKAQIDAFADSGVRTVNSGGDVQGALDQSAGDHMTVKLNDGTYNVSKPLNVPDGVTLQLSGGATITGSVGAAALVALNSGSTVTGGTIENTVNADAFDVFINANAKGATVDGVTMRGSNTMGVYASAPNISDLKIINNKIYVGGYGVLLNEGSEHMNNVDISGNYMTGSTADEIELNLPIYDTSKQASNFRVNNNTIVDMAGTFPGSGFAIGIAGVRDFTVSGNYTVNTRSESIHIEDHASNGTISNNIVDANKSDWRPGIGIYHDVNNVTISGNVVRGSGAQGFMTMWDARGSGTNLTVTKNIIVDSKDVGIVTTGDVGAGPFTVTNNVISHTGKAGIAAGSSHEKSTVRNNLILNPGSEAVAMESSGARDVGDNSSDGSVSWASVAGQDTYDRYLSLINGKAGAGGGAAPAASAPVTTEPSTNNGVTAENDLRPVVASSGNTVSLSDKTYDVTNFTQNDAGVNLGQKSLDGAGSEKTVVEMAPGSSTKASEVPVQPANTTADSFTTNPLYLMTVSGSPTLSDFTLKGTSQGHTYGGIELNDTSNAKVTNVTVKSVPAKGGITPNATFGIYEFSGENSTYDKVNANATGNGGIGFGANGSKNITIKNSYFHGSKFGAGALFRNVRNITIEGSQSSNNRTVGVKFIRVSGNVRIKNMRTVGNGLCDYLIANDKGSANFTIEDPKYRGKIKICFKSTYYGHKTKQDKSKIHVIVNKKDVTSKVVTWVAKY